MLVSTKGRYALRVMIDLAEHNNGEYITLKEIADRQNISEKYLESIISILSKAGFLEGLRGKGGGYKLSRLPEQYTVGSILKLTEGTLAPIACLAENSPSCKRKDDCRTLPFWEKLNGIIENYVESVTIEDLVKNTSEQINYSI